MIKFSLEYERNCSYDWLQVTIIVIHSRQYSDLTWGCRDFGNGYLDFVNLAYGISHSNHSKSLAVELATAHAQVVGGHQLMCTQFNRSGKEFVQFTQFTYGQMTSALHGIITSRSKLWTLDQLCDRVFPYSTLQ